MEVRQHLPLAELERLERKEPNARRAKRLRIVILAMRGYTAPAIAMSLGWRAQISASNGVFFSTSKSTSSVYYKHRRPPENWKGVVWNIRTDAGHMVVRRENKIAIVSTL